jgi:hypothetical protein
MNMNAMQEGREKPYKAHSCGSFRRIPSRTLPALFLFPSTILPQNRLRRPYFMGGRLRGKGESGWVREGERNSWGLMWFSLPPALHLNLN